MTTEKIELEQLSEFTKEEQTFIPVSASVEDAPYIFDAKATVSGRAELFEKQLKIQIDEGEMKLFTIDQFSLSLRYVRLLLKCSNMFRKIDALKIDEKMSQKEKDTAYVLLTNMENDVLELLKTIFGEELAGEFYAYYGKNPLRTVYKLIPYLEEVYYPAIVKLKQEFEMSKAEEMQKQEKFISGIKAEYEDKLDAHTIDKPLPEQK